MFWRFPRITALVLLTTPSIGCSTGSWTDDDPPWDDDDDLTAPAGDDDTEFPGTDDDDAAALDPCSTGAHGGQVPVDDQCLSVEPYETFAPDEVIEWQWTGSAVASWWDAVIMTPIVVNVTDDNHDQVVDEADMPDVIFNAHCGNTCDNNTSDSGRLRAISGSDGSDLWTLDDAAYATYPGSGLAAGDLDNDGFVEIVAITDDGEVMLVGHDGTVVWVTSLYRHFENGTQPAVADLMGDGDPEIIIGKLILSSSGSIVAEGSYGSADFGWGPMSFAADVDHDHVQEIVADNAVYEPDGTAKWANGGPAGYPAIGDFDLDGDPELVVVAGGEVHLYDANDGSTVWSGKPIVNGGTGGPPTVADYDGDGYPEIGVAGDGAYTVLDTDGSTLWWRPTNDTSSKMTGSSVFDFNGDGVAEVVYADQDALYVYEGPTGEVLFTAESHASGTLWENPVIVDLDHDNSAEIIVASNHKYEDEYSTDWHGITVLGAVEHAWYPARGIWNQHAYSITNIEDDGSIPADPMPPWIEHNSFRRNTLSDESLIHAPNVYLHSAEFCLDECPDELTLAVQVANDGLVEVGAGLVVSVYEAQPGGAGEFIASISMPAAVPSGTFSDPESIVLDPTALAGTNLRVVADSLEAFPGGLHEECREDDNAISLTVPPCN